MLKEKQQKAIRLRIRGFSLNEIRKKLKVSKGSVSLWVRNVELKPEQIIHLSKKGLQKKIVEKRRIARLKNEKAKRQIIIDRAKKQIKKISKKELWLMGIMLYWAEGGKTQRGLVRFSNGDPEMIKIMMTFFRRVCRVPEEKFRGYIHIHPHLSHIQAERYWSSITKIPLKKFFKTYKKTNVSSKNKKDTLPYGVMDIYICDTELFLKISGWVKGIFSSY